jgi:3-methyladenine DNA glycosylase AlkD
VIENIILTKSWWDTVDWLAGHAVGTYLNLYPEKKINVLSRWSDSENIWLIRSCIIFQLFYKEQTDTKLLEDMILGHTGTNEFFINKASGWALRQYSKTNPQWVIDFVNSHVDVLDKLTCTEALKWLKNNNLNK